MNRVAALVDKNMEAVDSEKAPECVKSGPVYSPSQTASQNDDKPQSRSSAPPQMSGHIEQLNKTLKSNTGLGLGLGITDYFRNVKRREWSFQKCVDYFLLPWETPVVLGMRVFRSRQAIQREIERQKEVNRYIIHRLSRFRSLWDIIMVLVLFVTLIVLPIEIAFYNDNISTSKWKGFNLMLDSFFLLDIVINFRTAYIHPSTDEVILNSKSIAYNYLRTWFVLDFVSSLPLDYMYTSMTGSDEHAAITRTLKVLRLTKLLSLLRIFRFVRFMRYIRMIEEALQFEGRVIDILNVVLLTVVFAHWNGCIQYFIPFLMDYPPDCWIILGDLQHENVTIWTRYTHSVYRALSHMVCIGYGAVRPVNNADIWTTIFSMCMGATFYAIFIGHMSAVVMDMNYSGRKYKERTTEVKEYMKFKKLPVSLQRRVLDYYEHRYQSKFFNEKDILSEINMSKPLKDSIMLHNCRSLVENVPFLANSPQDFMCELITNMHLEVYFPGEMIVKHGAKGDAVYFIEHGMVEVVLPNGTVMGTLEDGMYFGEIALLYEERRTASVIAVEMCDIYQLKKSDFHNVLVDYPSMKGRMYRAARRRLLSIAATGHDNVCVTNILSQEFGPNMNEMEYPENSADVAMWEKEVALNKQATLKNLMSVPPSIFTHRRSGIQVDHQQDLGTQDHYLKRMDKSSEDVQVTIQGTTPTPTQDSEQSTGEVSTTEDLVYHAEPHSSDDGLRKRSSQTSCNE